MEDSIEAFEDSVPLLDMMKKDSEDVRVFGIDEDVYHGSETSAHSLEWSDDEEKKLVRKIDFIVLALLILGFLGLQYDRGNIGNALTDDFLVDVGITQDQYNVGQQLLSCGIVLLEIPSNLILYKLGPRAWIGCQMFGWGLVSLFQSFQKGLGAFLATRLLLGLCESGFIPAGLYTITMWYKREESSARFAWFFIGNMSAAATTGLIAYGVLQMRGIAGLTGWQWLFIIEGLFTILVGFIFVGLFPKDPAHPVSFLGKRYFTERETAILLQRVLRDDPSKQKKSKTVSKAELLSALSNWRVYPQLLLTLSALAPSSTMASYAPTLVASFGYPKLRSNALVSVGNWLLIVTNLTFGWLADRTKNRGLWVLTGVMLYWGFSLGCLLVVDSESSSKRYALLMLAMAFSSNWHPLNGSWLALNAHSAGERSITMAMFIMAANASGIVGNQLFQAKDEPRYHTGWTVIVCLISVGVVFCAFANVQYKVLNRRGGRKGTTKNDADDRFYTL